jgi:hypothetical protein
LLSAFWVACATLRQPYSVTRGADDQGSAAAGARVHAVAQLASEHGELGQSRVQQPGLQVRIAVQHQAEDRHKQQQQREQRQEPVIGDQRREVAALIVGELVDDRDREADPAMAALEAVQ